MGNSSSSNGGEVTSNGGGERRPSLASRGLSHRIIGGGSNNNAQPHRSSLPHINLPASLTSPFRSGGSLGLSRAELDERCKPSGLYPSCEWEPKQIRRLISNGQLARRATGADCRLSKTDRECPICFMYYSETNISKCCTATLCTECYLQIKPGKDRYCICPFCNNPKMVITVAKGMDESDVARREEEEQRVIEATIRSRISQLHGDSPLEEDEEGGETASEGGSSFGSQLESFNRSRTLSTSSNHSAGASGHSGSSAGAPPSPRTPIRHVQSEDSDSSALISSLAMSPDERRALETEMRAQLSHETHRRVESEAEEARMRHAQEWYGSQAGVRSRMREARIAELTSLMERMTTRGGGAAAGGGGGGTNSNDGDAGNLLTANRGGVDGVGLGIGPYDGSPSLNRLLRAMESSSNNSGRGRGASGLEELMRLEAAFFLGLDNDASRSRRARRMPSSNSNESDEENYEDDDNRPPHPFGLGSRPSGGSSSSSRVERRLRRSANRGGGISTTHLDTAELLMRGVSEEEQMAMAIAMSMQEQQESQQQHQQGETQQNESGQAGGGVVDSQQEAETAADRGVNRGEDESNSSSSDDDSTDSSSESSGGEETEDEGNDTNEEAGQAIHGNSEVNDENNDAGNDNIDAVSLDEDEEEVIFAEA